MATYTGSTTATSMTMGTTGSTWNQWLQWSRTQHTAYITTTASTTWDRWIDVGYTNATAYHWQDEVWGEWIEDEAERAEHERMRQHQRDELQRLREQRSREQLAAQQARAEKMAEARVRARELLENVVAAGDWVPGLELIQVRGSDERLYRVELHRETVHGNVIRVDEHGCILGRACVAPAMSDGREVLPNEDGWLGQYLGLKFDAAEFLSHANWSSVRDCQRQGAVVPLAA